MSSVQNCLAKGLATELDNIMIPLCPKLCILLCLLQARRSIALCWKNVNCQSIGLWLKNLTSSLALEKLMFVLRKKIPEFHNSWESILDFIKNADIEEALEN